MFRKLTGEECRGLGESQEEKQGRISSQIYASIFLID
jgi:hypothetical protein